MLDRPSLIILYFVLCTISCYFCEHYCSGAENTCKEDKNKYSRGKKFFPIKSLCIIKKSISFETYIILLISFNWQMAELSHGSLKYTGY